MKCSVKLKYKWALSNYLFIVSDNMQIQLKNKTTKTLVMAPKLIVYLNYLKPIFYQTISFLCQESYNWVHTQAK